MCEWWDGGQRKQLLKTLWHGSTPGIIMVWSSSCESKKNEDPVVAGRGQPGPTLSPPICLAINL